MAKLQAYLSYWHKNAQGKTIKYRRYKSRSFVGNLLKFIKYFIGNVTVTTSTIGYTMYKATPLAGHAPKRLDGTVFTSVRTGSNILGTAGTNVTNNGIVVGTGTTPVSLADFRLASLTTALRYEAMPFGNISPIDMSDPNVWKFTITRNFSNTGTTPVTINEIGYIITHLGFRILIARDVLTEPITVSPNETIVIQYLVRFVKT